MQAGTYAGRIICRQDYIITAVIKIVAVIKRSYPIRDLKN